LDLVKELVYVVKQKNQARAPAFGTRTIRLLTTKRFYTEGRKRGKTANHKITATGPLAQTVFLYWY
jgi:hypothetical protein